MNKFVPKGKSKIVTGSILTPEYAGLRLIINFVNLSGKADSAMTELLDKKWKKIKEEVKGWHATRVNFKLGQVNTIAVQSDVWVINCLCQDENLKIDSKAIEGCIKKISEMALNEKASVHVSNILVNEYPDIVKLLTEKLLDNGINVSYYQEQVAK